MNETLLEIVLASIPVIGIIISGILIPLVKSKVNEEQRDKIMFWVEIATVAIEKHYEGEIGKGEIKKEYVMSFLVENLKLDKYVNSDQLSLIIDAVVEEIINKEED